MAALINVEVRRLLNFLKEQNTDNEEIAGIEDELRSKFGTKLIREPEFVKFF